MTYLFICHDIALVQQFCDRVLVMHQGKIVEEGTPFWERELKLPDEDTEYRMYEDTAAILGEYGFHQYEISNYAKKGRECRHNKGYWQRTDYLGFGLGASSLLNHVRFSNTDNMEEYLRNSAFPEKIKYCLSIPDFRFRNPSFAL